MLVVDAHVHIWPDRRFMPEHVWETFHWVWGRHFLRTRDEGMTAALLEQAWDPAGQRVIAGWTRSAFSHQWRCPWTWPRRRRGCTIDPREEPAACRTRGQ